MPGHHWHLIEVEIHFLTKCPFIINYTSKHATCLIKVGQFVCVCVGGGYSTDVSTSGSLCICGRALNRCLYIWQFVCMCWGAENRSLHLAVCVGGHSTDFSTSVSLWGGTQQISLHLAVCMYVEALNIFLYIWQVCMYVGGTQQTSLHLAVVCVGGTQQISLHLAVCMCGVTQQTSLHLAVCVCVGRRALNRFFVI